MSRRSSAACLGKLEMRLAIVSDAHETCGPSKRSTRASSRIPRISSSIWATVFPARSGRAKPLISDRRELANGARQSRPDRRLRTCSRSGAGQPLHARIPVGSVAGLAVGAAGQPCAGSDILLCHGSPTDDEAFLLEGWRPFLSVWGAPDGRSPADRPIGVTGCWPAIRHVPPKASACRTGWGVSPESQSEGQSR